MGTRNLTAVYCDGEYKIAQYGQWDGYPEGQGATALAFANKISDVYSRELFREKVRKCHWLTEGEISAIDALPDWSKKFPELSRNTGAEILELVNSSDGLGLVNNVEFAADSLFCEWAWVIDLDKNTFEGYEGFNKTQPLTEEDRFFFLRDKERSGYYGVKLKKKYSLDDLPATPEFLADFKEEE